MFPLQESRQRESADQGGPQARRGGGEKKRTRSSLLAEKKLDPQCIRKRTAIHDGFAREGKNFEVMTGGGGRGDRLSVREAVSLEDVLLRNSMEGGELKNAPVPPNPQDRKKHPHQMGASSIFFAKINPAA